jgi:hypothetical protein
MKNLFKKETKKEVKSTFQKLDKNQLEKVIGGIDGTTIDTIDAESRTGKITFKAKEGATTA